jgi:hypothetical protein
LRADPLRLAAERRRAADFANRDNAFRDVVERDSRFNRRSIARERLADGRPVRRLVARFAAFPFAGIRTPARLAFDSPIAIACFVERAPCFPSRT